jgi:glycosyltransferase involved in cell wall biosynthesis
MRILFVTPNPPAPLRVRPYELARSLAARGHELVLASPMRGPSEAAAVAALRGEGFTVLVREVSGAQRMRALAGAAASGLPFQARWAWTPALAGDLLRAVREAAAAGASFDLVHVEHLRGAAYGAALGDATGLPVVWDSVDCISRLFGQAARQAPSGRSRWMARLELARTRRHEAQLLRRFDAVLVTSEADADALRALPAPAARPPAPVHVVHNGVDGQRFSAGDPAQREPATIVLSGKMSYHANIAAARRLVLDIMPRVWLVRPEARVVLCGAEPAPEVAVLAARHPAHVAVTGTVPDVAVHLRRATVAVAPLVYGVGVQNKVLEAMACATPVVAAPEALRGLDDAATWCRVAQDDTSFAEHVLALLADGDAARALGQCGRDYVVRCRGWDAVARQVEAVYEQVAAARALEAVAA